MAEINKDIHNKNNVPLDDGGDCAGCGMAYSFVFRFQPHKSDCCYKNK